MKILVVNRNYFITGGPEQYWFRLQRAMPDCEFIPFCVGFEASLDTPYRKYFVDPPPTGGVYFKDFRLSPWNKIKYALDNVYSFDARRRLEQLIESVRPDVAYFLNAVYFTDSIIDACSRQNVPIVWRMSDFHKVCASYHLLRDNQVCEACISDGLWQALRHKCGGYQRSYGAAAIKVAGMGLSRLRRVYRHVRWFITPSDFTRTKLIAGGLPADRVVHVPTFVDVPEAAAKPSNAARKILYVGRLTEEKGLDVLLRAFRALPAATAAELVLVGDDSGVYAQTLKADYADTRIHFAGFRSGADISELFRQCGFFVVPSICYENLPNVVLEGMAQGRAPVVSKLGSLAEVVRHEDTGLHFEPGNVEDLGQQMRRLLDQPQTAQAIGARAHRYVAQVHNPDAHVTQLRSLLQSV